MTYCLAVEQALDDVSLPPAARLTMWHIRKRLTMTAFAEVKAESLAAEMRLKDTTVGQMLTLLVQRGYLDESGKKKPRAFRLPWSRRVSTERAA
jgi:DNA-binding IclR family transcriptional regulator